MINDRMFMYNRKESKWLTIHPQPIDLCSFFGIISGDSWNHRSFRSIEHSMILLLVQWPCMYVCMYVSCFFYIYIVIPNRKLNGIKSVLCAYGVCMFIYNNNNIMYAQERPVEEVDGNFDARFEISMNHEQGLPCPKIWSGVWGNGTHHSWFNVLHKTALCAN